MDYGLPAGYVERADPAYFDDGGEGDAHACVSQPDVYVEAGRVAEYVEASTIIDLGCGHAGKLRALWEAAPGRAYLGIDVGQNIEWCRSRWRGERWCGWLEHDLERGLPTTLRVKRARLRSTVVVLADVVEHLRTPEKVLRDIAASRAMTLVVSTPDRDLTYGQHHLGPPANDCHVREWNTAEFAAFLGRCGFDRVGTSLTRSDDQTNARHTILAECIR